MPDFAQATCSVFGHVRSILLSRSFRGTHGALIPNQRVRASARQLLFIDVYKTTVMAELTISEARKALLDLPEKLARTPERAVTITRRGQPVLAILPWEFYESIIETLDILGDPEMVKALRGSLEDLKRGRVVSNAEVKKRLGV